MASGSGRDKKKTVFLTLKLPVTHLYDTILFSVY